MDRRLWALVVTSALLFGLFTTYEHVVTLGRAYLEEGGEQITRVHALLAGAGGDPVQYRVLTAYTVNALVEGAAALGVPRHTYVSFILLRVAEDTLLFVLAFLYYRALGLSTRIGFVALSLLAWGMSYSHQAADLRFDTYLDVSFYLLAALCILRERYVLIVPLMAAAALNRETSGLIPFALLAHFLARSRARDGSFWLEAREALLVSAALAVFAAVFVALRLAYPPQTLVIPHDQHPGLPLLVYNLSSWITWVDLFEVLGIVPVLALVGYRDWPPALRVFAWSIVPVWLVIHAFASVMAEARLFLVPLALVFVPGAMFLIQADPARREQGAT